ncbi:MAG: hypothetical protein WCJ66_15860 [Verrucomicrobiota bacterium]
MGTSPWLLCKIDPHGFSDALNGWLAAPHGTLPRGLAIDGKYVRNLVLTLCLSEHESGAPAAIAIVEQAPVRVALISVRFRQNVTLPWPQIFEHCAHSSVTVMCLISGKSIK